MEQNAKELESLAELKEDLQVDDEVTLPQEQEEEGSQQELVLPADEEDSQQQGQEEEEETPKLETPAETPQ